MKSVVWRSVLSFALVLAVPAGAEGYKAPRNRLGQPDLEGTWSYNSLTRLERADRYSGVVIGEAEARSIPPPPLIPPDAIGQDETETYDAEGLDLARINGEIRTSWIVDPPDGRLPFTAAGRARANAPSTFDGPETRTSQERCLLLPNVGPPIATAIYNNNLQILQTRDHVVFSMEMNHEARIIPLGARSHGAVHRWMGDSVGRWDGDTLVIETTHIIPGQGQRTSPAGRLYLSPEAVVTERLRRISKTQILYSYTVVDPANYTQRWRGEMPLTTTKGPIFEYACHEGNYSLPNILAGARREEKAGVVAAGSAGTGASDGRR
jgi:hypothetical protein